MSKKLNRIKCAKCNTICTSRHRHDFVTCKCGAVSCDGGNCYQKVVGDLENILVFKNRKWVKLEFENEKPNENIVAPTYDKISNCPNISIFKTAFDCTMAPYKMFWEGTQILIQKIKRAFKP